MGLTERLFEIIDNSGFANLRALLPLDKGGEEATGHEVEVCSDYDFSAV